MAVTASLYASAAGDWAIGVATVLATVIAILGSAGAWTRWYRRTLGRRRHGYERLARLGTGAHLSFFESVLGQPPAIRQTVTKEDYREIITADDPRFSFELAYAKDPSDPTMHDLYGPQSFVRSIFVEQDFFVQTITNDDGTVVAFSVTTRSPRFTPTFAWPSGIAWRERRRFSRQIGHRFRPLFRVRLGRSRFAEFGDEETDDFAGPRYVIALGAHNYSYSEFMSFGNPGAYQTFVFTASDVAPGLFGNGPAVQEEVGGQRWPADDKYNRAWNDMLAARAFRRSTVVTTYTVIGIDLWDENFPTTFAPHDTVVRTLP